MFHLHQWVLQASAQLRGPAVRPDAARVLDARWLTLCAKSRCGASPPLHVTAAGWQWRTVCALQVMEIEVMYGE